MPSLRCASSSSSSTTTSTMWHMSKRSTSQSWSSASLLRRKASVHLDTLMVEETRRNILRAVSTPPSTKHDELTPDEWSEVAVDVASSDEDSFLVDCPELAAFLEQDETTTASYYSTTSTALQKAASFTGHRMIPCSPPVPIPTASAQWQRCSKDSSTGSSGSMRKQKPSCRLPPNVTRNDATYSGTQHAARLWDEYWNFKLSLEARESFESKRPARRSASNASDTSSNQETIPEDEDELRQETHEYEVFEMDDL